MYKIGRVKILFLSVVFFIITLMGINVFQYLKVKTDIAPALISEMSNIEMGEMRFFFSSISEQLNIVREWGANGVLKYENVIDLNKLFFPLLENKVEISGAVLASGRGDEYFLYRDQQNWITRQSSATDGKERLFHFTRWQSLDKYSDQWTETSAYDPRKTSWFAPPKAGNQIHWSSIHTFLHSGKPGITATVSWKNSSSADFTVFGLNIPLRSIEQFLTLRNKNRPGIIFIIKKTGDTYISSETNRSANPDMAKVLQSWLKNGPSHNSPVIFMKGKQRWLASFQPLDPEKPLFWLGVAAPEKEFLAQINSKLFQVDALDLLIAFISSALLALLLLKTGSRLPTPSKPSTIVRFTGYLNKGEGAEIELKSTIRANLKSGKNGKEIELAWLKAVVAFLNSAGGSLLIGIADSGEIIGLESDGFENRDKLLLHVKNLLNQHIGAEFSSFVTTTLIEIEDKEVVMIECTVAATPIFLKIGKNEEFYVRSGPSSTKLSPSQTVRYITKK